jgi:hypothetical protein
MSMDLVRKSLCSRNEILITNVILNDTGRFFCGGGEFIWFSRGKVSWCGGHPWHALGPGAGGKFK